MNKKKNKDYDMDAKMKSIFSWKNVLTSWLSEIRFIMNQYSFILLPLTISIPLSSLWLVSVTIFDKIFNKVKANVFEYMCIGFLIIGGIIVNFDKILNTQSGDNILTKHYIIGVICSLIAIVLSGYVYIVLQKLTHETHDPGYTMGVESGGSLLAAWSIFGIMWFFNKVNIPDFQTGLVMFIALTFLFNIDIIFKFIGFETIPVLMSIFLSQIYILITFAIGIFYYKESLTKYKVIGLVIIILASIAGSLFLNKKVNADLKLDKANDNILAFFSTTVTKIKAIFNRKVTPTPTPTPTPTQRDSPNSN